jgi:peroxiredoxin
MADAALEPGIRAPGFSLPVTPDQSVELAELLAEGRALIMAFYPADWSPVCTDQMALYNEVLPEFKQLGGNLVGVSVDGAWCHAAFAEHRRLHFPLLADFEPKGAVARSYGVYDERTGMSKRALFVLDQSGTIRWSYVSPVGVNPGADGILHALEELAPVEARV